MLHEPISETPTRTRKIIQISTATCTAYSGANVEKVHVLCDDGTVWEYGWDAGKKKGVWYYLPPIPQDEIAT